MTNPQHQPPELLTKEWASGLIELVEKQYSRGCTPAKMLQAIADGRAVAVQWVNDRDPPVDQEVMTLTTTGNLGLWLSDKDEDAGDWKRPQYPLARRPDLSRHWWQRGGGVKLALYLSLAVCCLLSFTVGALLHENMDLADHYEQAIALASQYAKVAADDQCLPEPVPNLEALREPM